MQPSGERRSDDAVFDMTRDGPAEGVDSERPPGIRDHRAGKLRQHPRGDAVRNDRGSRRQRIRHDLARQARNNQRYERGSIRKAA
jgi:hypothetical protein